MASVAKWTRIIKKGVFVGSGSDGVAEPYVAELILRLSGLENAPPEQVVVTYLGTATYDLERPRERQTAWFAARGCRVLSPIIGAPKCLKDIDVVAARAAIQEANILIVSGGNTLFMLDRWRACGLIPEIQAAAQRGAVMCGGSAGAICWFDAGHSDSLDPTSSRSFMLGEAAAPLPSSGAEKKDESSAAPATAADVAAWTYVRVPALGLLPGLCCPHHDKTQSNGIPRATDFERLLTPAERGICIDHWAALCIDGEAYTVHVIPGKEGSVAGCAPGDMAACSTATYVAKQAGVPGVWIKERDAVSGEVRSWLAPWRGAVGDLLRPATAALSEDPLLAGGRAANPIDS